MREASHKRLHIILLQSVQNVQIYVDKKQISDIQDLGERRKRK